MLTEEYKESIKSQFYTLLKSVKRDSIDLLVKFLEESDFEIAPASTVFHGNYEGGLIEHSLDVYNEAKRLKEAYKDVFTIDDESLIIAALLHDLCKVHMYKTEKRNRKNDAGQWEQYDFYIKDEKLAYGGHGSKSVFIAQQFIDLTVEESVAINSHMGSWDGNKSVGDAYEMFPLAWLIHVADEAATFLYKR